MALKDWSLTPATNATVTDGTYGNITFAENQNPNTVNDSARAVMAHVRNFYENIEWRDWGHTVVRTGNTTFTIASASTLASVYVVGRRIRCTDSSTLYGTITASTHSGSTHTVTVALDSGNLSASLSAVALGLNVENKTKIVTGTTGAGSGDSGTALHGLDATKIISVTYIVHVTASNGYSSGYRASAGYHFNAQYDASSVIIVNYPSESANIYSKPFTALIVYKE